MSPEEITGRVLRIAGGSYRVDVDGDAVECVLGGRMKQEGTERVAVGDRVRLERPDEGTGRIVEVLPRTSKLARSSPDGGGREQVIAANIDQLAAVFALRRPEPDLRMLDRLLVVAELDGLDAFVVLNKTDLAEEGGSGPDGSGEATPTLLPPALRPYPEIGYDVLPTSATGEAGLDELAARIEGRTTVLAGPSGAGKSTLLNAVVPGLDRRVGEVSERDGRGRHTTVNATLVPLGGGAYAVDTPGLQYLTLSRLSPAELAPAFPEFRPLVGRCKFNDCRHVQEPGCAVLEAVERGEVPESRHESYTALLEEVEEQREPWE